MDLRNRHCFIYLVGIILLNNLQFAFSQAVFDYIGIPGESNRSIQYNNNGAFAGAASAQIFDSTLVLQSSPSTTAPESGSKVFNDLIANRGFIKNLDAFGSHDNQPFLGNRNVAWVNPIGGGSATINSYAFGLLTSAASTTGRGITTNNNFLQRRRAGFNTSAATNTSAYLYSSQTYCFISPSAGLGGFYFSVGFGVSEATFQDSTRLAVGLVTAVPSASADPSNSTNCIMIGADALDTMLYLMFNDASGTCTKTALGSDFRNTNSNITWYKLAFYNPQGSSIVYYEVLNCYNGVRVTGSINSNLPSSSSLFFPIVWRNTGLISVACSIDFNNLYLETEY